MVIISGCDFSNCNRHDIHNKTVIPRAEHRKSLVKKMLGIEMGDMFEKVEY